MIQIAAAVPTIAAGPARPVLAVAQSGASTFALALSSLLVPGAAAATMPGEALATALPMAERQIAAEPGKELPDLTLDLSDEEDAPEQDASPEDDAHAGEDLPFAWFALPSAPATEAAPVVPIAAAPKATVTPPLTAPETIVDEKPSRESPPPKAGLPGASAPGSAPVPGVPVAPVTPVAPVATVAPPVTAPNVPGPAAAQPRSGETSLPTGDPAPVAASVAPPQRFVEPAPVVAPRIALPVDTAKSPAPVAPTPVPVAADAPDAAIIPVASATPIAFATPAASAIPVALAAPQPEPRAEAPPLEPVHAATPATCDVPDAPAPGAAGGSVAHTARARVPEAVQPLTAASLIAQMAAQPAARPIAFAPLRQGFGELDQPAVTTIAAPGITTLQQVAAATDAQQGALDMRRQEWTGKMIDMIEAMREAAPVKETRISLIPDALGKVDISVRQDGDRVHLHFATETQAARQILTDAQPRLSELAEARGIRLGQTSVDSQGGAGAQSGQRQQDAPRPQNASAPASARGGKDQLTNTDDDRVA